MKKKLVLGVVLALAIFAVSIISNVQACNTTKGRDKERYLPLVAYTTGSVQGLPPPPPPPPLTFHVKFLGTGVASHLGRISLTGDEFGTFDKFPNPTQVSFTGTVTWTSKCGDTLTVTYQCTAKIGEGFHGTFQITGGTGRFEDAIGEGQTWGKAEIDPATKTGTFTQWFLGAISY